MARKGVGDYCIPFENGNQLVDDSLVFQRHYDHATRTSTQTIRAGCSMEPNHEFQDTLTFQHTFNGYGAFIRYSNGKQVNFMSSELDKVVPHMVRGVIKGIFTFTKRGTAYGCKLVQAD